MDTRLKHMAVEQTNTDSAQSVPQKTIADLFNDLPFRHFPHRQMILYQGDKIDRLYYIISGYVRMYNITPKGNERILAILGPGESLPLIQSEHAQYFYDAFTDVEAAYSSYEQIVERFLADSDYMEVARASGVKLMERMMEQMDMLSTDSAQDKVELALRFLAKHYGDEADGYSTIKFRVTHQELGNLVNLTRETVSNLVQKLERKKIIKTNNSGHIKVFTRPEDMELIESNKRLKDRISGGIRLGSLSDSEATAEA